jgi:hypothetical protein
MSRISRTAFLAAAGLALGACADDVDVGRIDLSLTGRATSGATYRLRDAQLTIAPEGQVFYTEDDPDRATISTQLESGLHTVELAPGWRLERLTATGAEPVFAVLTSQNPQPFDVVSGQVTPVRLTFRADHDDVVTGPGGADISIGVDDTGIDAGAPPPDAAQPPGSHPYVISRVELPTSSTTPIRLDLDGDGDSENRLGLILNVLTTQGSIDFQSGLDRGIARGDTILLAEVGGNLDHERAATFAIHDGRDPQPTPCLGPDDEVCGRHLDGNGGFRSAPTSPPSRVDGTIAGARFVGGSGTLTLRLPLAGQLLELPLVSAGADLTGLTDTHIAAGVIGGALTRAGVDTHFTPFLTAVVGDIVARDCTGGTAPDCGCSAGSTGGTVLGLFDSSPVDCHVSVEEVSSSAFVRTLLSPDLDLDGDGSNDAVSAAFGVSAVRASWPH